MCASTIDKKYNEHDRIVSKNQSGDFNFGKTGRNKLKSMITLQKVFELVLETLFFFESGCQNAAGRAKITHKISHWNFLIRAWELFFSSSDLSRKNGAHLLKGLTETISLKMAPSYFDDQLRPDRNRNQKMRQFSGIWLSRLKQEMNFTGKKYVALVHLVQWNASIYSNLITRPLHRMIRDVFVGNVRW